MSMQSFIRFYSVTMFAIILAASGYAKGEEMENNSNPLCSNCGWFWHETKQIDEDEPMNALPSAADLWEMDSDEFTLYLDNARKEAVSVPTIEKVKNYFVAQDVARRKSAAFANVADIVSKMYPKLSGGEDMPITAPGRKALLKTRRDEIEQTIAKARSEFALLYFHSQECNFCKAQNGILRYFANKYRWVIKTIDTNHDPMITSRFNVHTTPTLLLLYKQSHDYILVAAGVVSLSQLVKGLFSGIRLLRGEITPQQSSLYEFERGGYYDPAVYQKEPEQ